MICLKNKNSHLKHIGFLCEIWKAIHRSCARIAATSMEQSNSMALIHFTRQEVSKFG
jgi:hypothetical protein